MATEPAHANDQNEVFRQLEDYPWDTDREFQGGLSAILGPIPPNDPDQVIDLTLRAQCFYLSRKKSIPIDFIAYRAYLSNPRPTDTSHQTPNCMSDRPSKDSSTALHSIAEKAFPGSSVSSTTLSDDPPPHPANFQEIIALIQSGAPIPGIRDIPDTVLHGQSSVPVLPKRKKPWEKELPNETGGTFGDRRDEYIVQELPEDNDGHEV